MTRASGPRDRRLNMGVDSMIRRIVRQPVKEAVREALAEEREGSATNESRQEHRLPRFRRAIPLVFGVVVAAIAIRRRRRTDRAGYGSDVEGTSADDETGAGEPVHVETTPEE